MKKYSVYINAGIEIHDEIEATSKQEAREKAYDLISGYSVYQYNLEVEEIEE